MKGDAKKRLKWMMALWCALIVVSGACTALGAPGVGSLFAFGALGVALYGGLNG